MKLFVRSLSAFIVGLACWSSVSALPLDPSIIVQQPRQATAIDNAKRYTAWKVAGMLEDRHFVAALERHLAANDKPVMLNRVLTDYSTTSAAAKAATATLRAVDQSVREQKAIAADSKDLMELRLYTPRQYVGRVDWKNLLVAYRPAGKRKQWTTVEAFDRNGVSHSIDARTPPTVPILIAGINCREDLRAGTAFMNRQLQRAGLQTSVPRAPVQALGTGDIETTKLDRVRLQNDQEPWISGAAEIYAVVSGIQPDQAKAALTVVDMPYLDYDGITYSPNQIMIFWSEYRYAAANLQLFEHDDNTNYKDLAIALSQGVTAILGAFAPSYAVIGTVASAILQAMPASWFSNDDDYVDSFYTLEKGRTYTSYVGGANNATVTLSPYQLQAQ